MLANLVLWAAQISHTIMASHDKETTAYNTPSFHKVQLSALQLWTTILLIY